MARLVHKGEPLTERELSVLAHAAPGRTNRQIARSLGISAETVKTHLHHVMAKLDVPNRTAAVTAGFRQRLIDIHDDEFAGVAA